MEYTYQFRGHRDYQTCEKEIKKLLENEMGYADTAYYIAINEAVCNAVLYGNAGVADTEVQISVVIERFFIVVKVRSNSEYFDTEAFRKNLNMIAEKNGNIDWRVYKKNDLSGRGIWMMLTGADFVLVESQGHEVSLIRKKPYQREFLLRGIKDVVSRFYIEKNGAVL